MPFIQTPSIANVVEDQTPQLGGNLDCQNYQLSWAANGQSVGEPVFGSGLVINAGTTNLDFISNGNIDVTTNSSLRARFESSGGLSVGGAVAPLSVDSFYDLGTTSLRWANTYTDTITIGNGVDAILTADAADELALRNSTTAQAFHVYNTYTDASNYERLEFKWDTNVATIDSTAAGTGTARPFDISYNGSRRFRGDSVFSYIYQANGTYLAFGVNDFKPQQDSTVELGASGNRWATTYTDGIATSVETFTAASDTLDAKNNVALCDCTSNAITLNLPVGVIGTQYVIKKIDATANAVTIDANGAELIDGAGTQTINTQYESITIVSDGSDWFIV